MSHTTIEYLYHILDETSYILAATVGLRQEQFIHDETLKRAFVRSLEVIGEAAKQIPSEFRQKYSSVAWRAMTGMRDVLIHKYFGIDYDIVWDVVSTIVPELHVQITEIVRQETSKLDQ